MGMAIDDAIAWLNTDDYESKGFADATSIAIDTMRKYQKIQEIIANWNNEKINNIICCLDIKEVLENGNVK